MKQSYPLGVRLSIRAVCSDDPVSAIGLKTERIIHSNIGQMKKEAADILISRCLETFDEMDRTISHRFYQGKGGRRVASTDKFEFLFKKMLRYIKKINNF